MMQRALKGATMILAAAFVNQVPAALQSRVSEKLGRIRF